MNYKNLKNHQDAQKIIMENYLNPQFKTNDALPFKVELKSQSCTDHLILKADIEDNAIKKLSFDGSGCAVFIASNNIFCKLVLNKSIDETKKMMIDYQNMVKNGDLSNLDKLGDLKVFANVKKHLNRVECALLITYGFEELLKR